MNKILTTISILIYTVYSQGCSNSHDVSTMISYSIHGPSVNDLIGATDYLDVVKGAAAAFTQGTGSQRVGVTAFGGISTSAQVTDAGTFVWDLSSLAAGNGATVASVIDGFTPDYENNYGNAASGAITTARSELSGETGRQKYHVIFSATLPLASQGRITKPSNADNICGGSITAKQLGIQQYVVLIGTEGVNVFPSFWACAVENPDTDIIIIDPTAPDYTDITARLCKPNGYDIKITEVKPTSGDTDTNGNGYNAYIEVLNRGAEADIMAGFSGDYSSAVTTGTGEYFLARRTSGGGTNAAASNQATLPSVSPTASAWTANARIGSCSDEDLGCYDEVIYNAASTVAVTSISGRSFELRAMGYNNDYPSNWRNSCFKTQTDSGTPGADNLAVCEAISNGGTTATTILSGSCGQTAACNANGAGLSADDDCSSTGTYCDCDAGTHMGDVDTCRQIALPESTNGCVANIVNWWDGSTYILYQWPRVEFDGEVSYTMRDANPTTYNSIGNAGYGAAYNDLTNSITDFTIDLTASYIAPIQGTGYDGSTVSGISCGTPVTLDPTKAPTGDPTVSPTSRPSGSPTLQPTFDAPGVYMTSVKTRGDCGEEARSCCSPFGPQYGDTNTGTDSTGASGTLPSNADECSIYDNNIAIEIQDSVGSATQQQFEFNLYPSGFADQTNIVVKIYAYGLINSTEFEDLSFAGNYVNDGLIPGIVTTTNQFIWGPTTRRRLQNGTSNQYENGNKLNIGVAPPGSENLNAGDLWEGTVTVPDDSTSAFLNINITLADLDCNEGDIDCTTLDDCTSQSLAFVIVAQSCTSITAVPGDCKPLYPSTRFFSIARSEALCFINFNVGNNEDELPDWFWWVLIALIVFLLILAWLVYRFWWKQKKTAAELGDAEDELDQQIADNEAGFGKELDVGDVAFNPMATGVPGMNRPADAFGNELHQRQIEQQNDMVDVQAEIFQVRQDYGQVNTGNRHHNNQMGGY